MDTKRIKAAVGAAGDAIKEFLGPGRYAPGGKPLVCPHCGGTSFQMKSVMVAAGHQLACSQCGLIQWFAQRPVRADGDGS